MAYLLFLFGLVGIMIGGYLTYSMFSAYRYIGSSDGVPVALAMLISGLPGIAMMLGGVLLLAAGECLIQLANIARSVEGSRRAAEATAHAMTNGEAAKRR